MGSEWMFEGPLRRRELLRGGAGLALGLGLAGCGVGNEATQVDQEADREASVKAEPDGDLVYFNWSEYLEPKLIKEFEKQYGVKVRESNFDSMQGMMAKLRSGNRYDLIFPAAEWVDRLRKANQLLRDRQGADPERRPRSTTTSPSPGTTRAPTTRCPTRCTRAGSSTARTRSS